MLRIALLGDIALFGKYSADNKDIYNYFSDVAKELKKYDYVIGNLETPLCEPYKTYGCKSAHIRAETKNIEILKYLNINIVNLANNHIFDYGIRGYNSTKDLLEENGIDYFGIENKQIKVEKNNDKVAFAGYCCYSTNGLGYYNNYTEIGVNVLDVSKVEKMLIKNAEEEYLNILGIHAGQEHVNLPNYDHIDMARGFAKKVNYVYWGHHPHVIQGMEQVNSSIIAYSLGNFCFDDVYAKKSMEPLIKQSEENRKSFFLALTVENNKVIDYETIPIYAESSKMIIEEYEVILNDLIRFSELLKIKREDYINLRKDILKEYINNRKSRRDFNWYIKRMNIKSIGMIYCAIKNRKKYKQLVRNKVQKNA